MYLLDANILLYAKISSFKEHRAARSWLDNVLSSGIRCGLPWESLTAFIRIASNPRILERPLSLAAAWEQVDEWLSCDGAWIPTPIEGHRELLAKFVPACKGSSGLIHDAHLAAIARSHGLTIITADQDFARFEGIRWENPLAGRG